MSLGFAVTFTAMMYLGAREAMVIAAIESLTGCIWPKRQKAPQMAFNVSLSLVETLLGSLVYFSVTKWQMQTGTVEMFGAVIASSGTYYLANTFGVATIIALVSGQSIRRLWAENFLWTAPSFFAGACISSLTLLLVKSQAAFVVLFMVPVLYFVYQSYSTYINRSTERQNHIEELQLKQQQLAELYLATIKSLALAIDAKDQYTHQHILRVQIYSVAIAKEMGLTGDELEAVNTGALLHDIGKLGVPEYVLLKPGRLTEEEFDKIKAHPEIGASILEPVEFPWPVLPVVRHHHEKWDGSGYPDGLKGEEIPLTARIMAAADVYDALTSSRSYRGAWTHERAVETINNDAGTHFDPRVVDAFNNVIHKVVQELAADGQGPLVRAKVASQASRADAANRAARDISRSSTEVHALYVVAQTLSSSLGLEETIAILGRKLGAIFPGVSCVFFLRSEDGQGLKAASAFGANAEFFMGSTANGSHSLTMKTLLSGVAYAGPYESDDLMLVSSDSATWTPMESTMIVPIIHQTEVLGSINLYHSEVDAFDLNDRNLFQMIAERAAMAVYNGMLFDRTKGHAFTDSLTGLYNLRYITQLIEDKSRIGHRLHSEDEMFVPTERFALLCLDLDSFKPINDNFGHQKGDQVLKDLAEIIKNAVRDSDIVARYGGDEFLVYLHDIGPEAANSVIQKIQEAVDNYDPGLIHYRLGNLKVGVSIGYGCYPTDADSFAGLVSVADQRMYEQKNERKLFGLSDKKTDSGSGDFPHEGGSSGRAVS
jgi:diguanylate cyclase (GGDEF)-like protein/putative nucleotidyltransferase with HDIG domain